MRSSAAGTGVRSEVAFWLERRGIEPRDEAVSRIFGAAKRSDRPPGDGEIAGFVF